MQPLEPGDKALLREYLHYWCRGRERAMQVPILAKALNLPERLIRDLAAQIAQEEGAVGSAVGKPAGLYWIVDLGEAREAEAQLMSRIREMSRRAAALRRRWPQLEQSPLPFEVPA